MASGLILAGLGLAAVGFAGRYAFRYSKNLQQVIIAQLPSAPSKYYRGGFEPKMSKREAALVLGVSPTVSKSRLRDAHKKIMIANHPDKGGSPYLAAKINEAKDYLEKSAR